MGEVIGAIVAGYCIGVACMIPVSWECGDDAKEKFAIVAAWPLWLLMMAGKGLASQWRK